MGCMEAIRYPLLILWFRGVIVKDVKIMHERFHPKVGQLHAKVVNFNVTILVELFGPRCVTDKLGHPHRKRQLQSSMVLLPMQLLMSMLKSSLHRYAFLHSP
ncbi:uncharacterized protein [Nicotiana sylvestris]|uniref:uncharacterized protein n=1 Tax=Nicotiana sylvestris TaxID=4096 RepID=UPI00388CB341